MANANAGRLAGVRWDGHQVLVKRELKKGVDQRGKAKDTVNRNCVVIVKLKGSRPLIFQDSMAKQVNRKGVVSLLKGVSAEFNLLIVNVIILVIGLEKENCFKTKGNSKGVIRYNQFSWKKFDVPGSNIFSTCVTIIGIC